jgi:hypothetical protein
MPAQGKESANFVFHGTVKKTKATNVKIISDTARTAIVAIDKVVRAPQSLADFAGHDVTVQLAQGEQVRTGQRLLFHTTPSVFGENLAVQSLGHDPLSAVAAKEPVADPVRAATHQTIEDRSATAAAVITGKVVAVGLPGSPATAAPQARGGRPQRISEHDPLWREAVVEVNDVHKGAVGKGHKVLVRFPSSSDVRWHRAPKFQVGQQGVFLLQPDDVSGHQTVGDTARSFAPDAAYTALHHADFQPMDHEAEAAAAISAAKR